MPVEDDTSESMNENGRKPMGWLQLLGEVSYTLKASMGNRLPDEFWQHAHTARREGMMAVRTLLDAQINRLEQQEQQAKQARERHATKIDVQ